MNALIIERSMTKTPCRQGQGLYRFQQHVLDKDETENHSPLVTFVDTLKFELYLVSMLFWLILKGTDE